MSSSQESLNLSPSGVKSPSPTARGSISVLAGWQSPSSLEPPGNEVVVSICDSLPKLPVGTAASSSASMAPPSGAISSAPSPEELEEAAVRKKQPSAQDAELAMLMEQASIDEKGKAARWHQSSHDPGRFPSPARSLPQETNNGASVEPHPISELKPKVHRLKKNCVVQFGDQEGIGGLRSRPGYTIQAFLDGGRWGDPSLIIRFKTNKAGRASMPLNREPHRQDFFDLRLFAGHVAGGDATDQDQALFMLDDFQWEFLSAVSDLDQEQQLVWLSVEEKQRPSLVELSMFVNDHLIIGRVDGESWQQHGDTFSRSLEIMDAKSYALRVWFHTPIIQPPWVECMMGPFLSAYESRHHDIQSLNRTSVLNPLAQGRSGTLSRLPGDSVTRKKDSASNRSKNTAGKRKNIKPPEKTRTFVAAPNKDTHKNEVHRKEALDWSALGRSRAAAVRPQHSTIIAPDEVEVNPEQQ